MKRLYATQFRTNWSVSSARVHDFHKGTVIGSGKSLPAAYLNYLRELEKEVARNKADKAEEQRCISAIIAMQMKVKMQPPTNQEHVLVGDIPPKVIKPWWKFWK